MPAVTGKLAAASLALALIAASASTASAQKKYDTGATDTEIKVGNIMPYSGPASAYGIIGRTEAACFMTFSRVRSSPHICSTFTIVCAAA